MFLRSLCSAPVTMDSVVPQSRKKKHGSSPGTVPFVYALMVTTQASDFGKEPKKKS
jgi:hypothetical protein